MVLCVGNHSSGKSSFINYVLGRTVQTAGVAPTDDCFTIIAPNEEIHPDGSNSDYDQDGFAIIGNPDFGFTSLRQFGPTLQHHTVFKLRSNINSNFIIGTSRFCAICRRLHAISFLRFDWYLTHIVHTVFKLFCGSGFTGYDRCTGKLFILRFTE